MDPIIPKFRFLSMLQVNQLSDQLGLIPEEEENLRILNQLVFAEYLKLPIHIKRFQKLKKSGYSERDSLLLVFKFYCIESKVY